MPNRKTSRTLATLGLLACTLFNATARALQGSPPKPAGTTQQSSDKAAGEDAARRREAFEIVWQTVREQHFDPTLGGLDWDAVRAEFAPLVERARTDEELHFLLQQMINRVGQSHFVIVPPEAIADMSELDEGDAGETVDEGEEGKDEKANGDDDNDKSSHKSRGIAERMTHGVGLDFRIIGGAAVVTRVEPGLPAERAGLRAGFVLRSVDGRPVRRLLADLRFAVLFNPSLAEQLPAEFIAEHLNGPAGTTVRVAFLDARGRVRSATLTRERLRGELSAPALDVPAQFVEFETRTLRQGIGYIRFNVFAPPVLEKFCAALRSMSAAPAILIDLRGNRGGALGMVYGLGGLLVYAPTSFGTVRTRAGRMELTAYPQKNSYRGQLIILLDSSSVSASEIFAAGLQEAGRATVVGEKSAGRTLPSTTKELPTGAVLQYAFADFTTRYGQRLEGAGLRPDIAVKLDRRSLLRGRDPQLEAALDSVYMPSHGEISMAPPGAAVVVTATLDKDDDKDGSADAAPAPVEKGAPKQSTEPEHPMVAQVLEKYLQAVGGREAWSRVTSRVSKGRFEGDFAGRKLSGELEIFERAPDVSVTVINVPGFGEIRRGFTGEYGYEQVPLGGFRQFEGAELEHERLNAGFRRHLDLRGLYPQMTYMGKIKTGNTEAHVIYGLTPSARLTRLYFDAQTGLLIQQDDIHLEDYRKVDDLMIPFTVRMGPATYRLSEVRHNVAFDDTSLREQKNCLTQ